jgi:tubulin polyglutamylase TTLL6/13
MDISFITDTWSVDDDLAQRAKCVRKQPAFVCQEYIHPPHLIAGVKYDLRLYVLITHSQPALTVWLFDEGLVRFCSRPYVRQKLPQKKKTKMKSND